MSNLPLAPSCSMNRRTLLNTFGMGLGGITCNELLYNDVQAANGTGSLQNLHREPKAKRVIYLSRPVDLLSLICLMTSQSLVNGH